MCKTLQNGNFMVMKTDKNIVNKKEPKKKLSLLERVMKAKIDPEFKKLHLLLEPHEIPLHIS